MTVIEDYCQPKLVKFEEIDIGDFFKWNNFVYVKTSHSSSVTTNALNLSNQETGFFYEDDLVQAVNATITIEPC